MGGLSHFVARDLIRYIIPTIIAFGLYIPLVDANVGTESIVFGGAFAGYIISTYVGKIAERFYYAMPVIGQKLLQSDHRRAWWMRNIDYTKLWYTLSKDDREYIYQTQGYSELYLVISFYVMLYFFINIGILLQSLITSPHSFSGVETFLADYFWSISTPMLGGWNAPTLAIAIVAFLLFRSLLNDYVTEYKALWGDEGQYVRFAEVYHRKGIRMTRAVWGRVCYCGQSSPRAEVCLKDTRGRSVSVVADVEGWYAIDLDTVYGNVSRFTLCARAHAILRCQEVHLDEHTWPHFDLEVHPGHTPR